MWLFLSPYRTPPFNLTGTFLAHADYLFSCSAGSYPTVTPGHSGEWTLNSHSHSIDWIIGKVDAESQSGTLEFSVGGDDPGAFFPVKTSFVGQGSLAAVSVASVTQIDNGEEVLFSEDARIMIDSYSVV